MPNTIENEKKKPRADKQNDHQCSQGYWKEKKTLFCHITNIWCVGESN